MLVNTRIEPCAVERLLQRIPCEPRAEPDGRTTWTRAELRSPMGAEFSLNPYGGFIRRLNDMTARVESTQSGSQ